MKRPRQPRRKGWMFTFGRGKAALSRREPSAPGDPSYLDGGQPALRRLRVLVPPISPILTGRAHAFSWDSGRASNRRSAFRIRCPSGPRKPTALPTLLYRPGRRRERGGRGPGGRERREGSARSLRAAPGADCAAQPGDAARRVAPVGLGRAPGAEGRRDSGAGLTHEEAEEVQADEQHPLAAALPRVVVERRAAAVLALRDDRLVVLVVLHGAGQDAPRQQSHTQTPGSPPGRGCSGRGGRVRPRCPLPTAGGGAFCSPGAPLLFLPQPRIVRKSSGERANSRAETSAAPRCCGRAGLRCLCAKQRAGSAGA